MRLAIWVAIGLAMLATIPEAVAPQKDSTSYDLALLDLAEAYKSKSPEAMARTVFAFGGSHLAYGLDSAQFAEAGLELANLGLNVGVGLAYPMHLIDWIRTALPTRLHLRPSSFLPPPLISSMRTNTRNTCPTCWRLCPAALGGPGHATVCPCGWK